MITLTTDQQAPGRWTGESAAELPVRWESGDLAVARVVPSEDDPLQVMVVAVAPGETWVSATDAAGVFLFADVRVVAAPDPVAVLDGLGARWSPDLDAFLDGELDASQVRCVLCTHAPCDCPEFGTPEYMDLIDKLHGR